MSNREASMAVITKVVEDSKHEYFPYRWTVNKVMELVSAFNDDTIAMFADALQSDSIGKEVTSRSMLLLSSGQIKNLEPTIRNIVIFAEAEVPHYAALELRSKTWKALHPVESYARKRVCGAKNALETPEQAVAMVAAAHALFAIIGSHTKLNDLHLYFVEQTSRTVMRHLDKGTLTPDFTKVPLTGAYELIDFFVAHPEHALQFSEFVYERGILDPAVLEGMLASPKALAVGVL
jgi:hypothetical protein